MEAFCWIKSKDYLLYADADSTLEVKEKNKTKLVNPQHSLHLIGHLKY